MSELLTQAVDICRKLIGEKTTPEINEIEAAITNITHMPLFKDINQSILKDMLLSLYTTKVDTFQILEGKERREPWLFSSLYPDKRYEQRNSIPDVVNAYSGFLFDNENTFTHWNNFLKNANS